MDIELSAMQERCIADVKRWLHDPHADQIYFLAGFAGSGKTTLARIIASLVRGEVRFAAYTGKAALVLRQKGCAGASTIHSLIYISHDENDKIQRYVMEIAKLDLQIKEADEKLAKEEKADERNLLLALLTKLNHDRKRFQDDLDISKNKAQKPMFRLNPESELRWAKLLIVDECSMVDEKIGKDLESFDVKILVLGDTAQLPPVGGGGYFTNREPDFLLTEIHRQAAENPILRVATMARQEKYIPNGKYGDDCIVLDNHPGMKEKIIATNQLLVGKNATRNSSNRRYRALLRERGLLGGDGDYPTEDDKLVCLRNDHKVGLLNGSLWRTRKGEQIEDWVELAISSIDGLLSAELVLEVQAHAPYFVGKGEEIPWFQQKDFQAFDYGYALTVHKAQGSQWDDVVLFDEAAVFRGDRWKWLYTGITRAAKSLTLVRL